MKKYLPILAIITCLYSCSSTPKLLCQTWRVKNIDFSFVGKNIDSTVRAGMIQQLKDSMVVVFNADHTHRVTGMPDGVEEGTWKMGSDPHLVYLKNSKSESVMTIKSINVRSMVAIIVAKDSTTLYCDMYKAAK